MNWVLVRDLPPPINKEIEVFPFYELDSADEVYIRGDGLIAPIRCEGDPDCCGISDDIKNITHWRFIEEIPEPILISLIEKKHCIEVGCPYPAQRTVHNYRDNRDEHLCFGHLREKYPELYKNQPLT